MHKGPAVAREDEYDGSKRNLLVPGKRAWGLLALALLPVLAISGLTSIRAEAEAAAASLTLSVEYPRVLRFLEPALISIALHNPGPEALSDVRVTLDLNYLGAFIGVAMTPDAGWLGSEGLVVELDDLAPEEARFIRIELRGNSYWWHPGEVSAAAGGSSLSVPIGTLVLP